MNYQKQPPPEVLKIFKDRSVEIYDIDYYAWPQVFGDTAGPRRGGMAGQTVSAFTVEAWVGDGCGPTVYTCAGMYCWSTEQFKPFGIVKRWQPLPKVEEVTHG